MSTHWTMKLASRVADEALSLAGTAVLVAVVALRRVARAGEAAAPALHRAAAAVGGRTAASAGGLTPEQVRAVRATFTERDAAAYLSHDWPAMPDPIATVTGLICRRCKAVSDEASGLLECGAATPPTAAPRKPAPRAPLYVPGSCPRCRGKLVQGADGGTWTCGGVPDEAWARALLAGRASALPGERVTEEHVRELVGRPACGWSGAEATRGDLWS